MSAVVPQATDREPQELLPIIPPRVHRLADDGSGPNVSPCGAVAFFRSVSTTPGCTVAVRASTSMSVISVRYRDVSITTPPMALPASEVPPPRGTTGAPASEQAATAATTSSTVRGSTTASGTSR